MYVQQWVGSGKRARYGVAHVLVDGRTPFLDVRCGELVEHSERKRWPARGEIESGAVKVCGRCKRAGGSRG